MIDPSGLLFAYIDPGTGSLLLQILLATLLSAGVVFRRLIAAPLALLFCGQRRDEDVPAGGESGVGIQEPKERPDA